MEKKEMKTTLKAFLAISLFCTVALADGNQGSGGSPILTEPTKTPVLEVVVSVVKQFFGLGF